MTTIVIWYTPFPDGSFWEAIKFYVSCASMRKHKTPKTYTAMRHGETILLPGGDQKIRLYVVGHGNFSNQFITGDDVYSGTRTPNGFTRYAHNKLALTPAQLLALLVKDRLLPRVKDIRLWACIGARGTNSFADKFGELVFKRWPQISVYGYTDYLLLTSVKAGQTVMDQFAATKDAGSSRKSITEQLKRGALPPPPESSDDDSDDDDAVDPFSNPFAGAKVMSVTWTGKA